MGMKTKAEAMSSIRKIVHVVKGKEYPSFCCYIGTDRFTHEKIQFEANTKPKLEQIIKDFFAKYDKGVNAMSARNLATRDLSDYLLARTILRDAGHADVTLVEAARAYCRTMGSVNPCTLGEAFAKYLATFSESQTTQIACVRARVGAAVNALGPNRVVSTVTAQDICSYLDRNYGSGSAKTYNNHLSYVKTFFGWCAKKERSFCSENPIAETQKKPEEYSEPEFITAKDLRTVFDIAREVNYKDRENQFVWLIALNFFAGIRGDEICRLRRGDVRLDDGYVRVAMPKGVTRGIKPRIVYLTDAAKAWMRAYPVPLDGDASHKLLPEIASSNTVYQFVHRQAERTGRKVYLPKNAGRHSFITMHVALYADPKQTEAMVGTSSAMRVNHYQGLATKAQAVEYFSVRPDREPASKAPKVVTV